MTAEAKAAVANALSLEAKKDSLRQLQDGQWTLTLKVHPEDMPFALLTASMGTRFQCAFVQLDDDETPVQQPKAAKATPKPEKSLAQEAGALCNSERFQKFLRTKFTFQMREAEQVLIASKAGYHEGNVASEFVRARCGVGSRSEFDADTNAAQRWIDLRGQYRAWLEAA